MESREFRLRRFHFAVRFSLIVLAALALIALPAFPQTGVGTVSGTVHDTSEGVVSGVKVIITNTETGISRQAETSPEGIYSFSSLPIGAYRLTAEKQGFETWAGTLTLNVGQSATVNPVLRLGSINSVVEVKDAAAPIETTRGVIGDVRESSQIRDLPLNGRDVGLLFGLTAGVESGAGGARVNGMKVGSLDINLDGVTQVDRFGGGIVRVRPGIETVQEFRIETSGSDASFAQPATVIMATRSGTNQLHFAAYEYNRDNTVVAPTRMRTDPVDVQVPHLIRNEFGGYVGGPVVIPHLYHGRDKTFWLFDYEGLRDHERSDPLFPFVPTAAMWNGDLSNAIDFATPCNPSGPNCTPAGYAPIIIYDPTTTDPNTFQRQPFPNNQIPGPLNQTAAALKALTALPTNNNNPFDFNNPNFTSTYPNISRTNTYTIKVDQNFTDKDRLSVRYTKSWLNSALEGGYFANPIDTSSGMGTSANDYYVHNVHANYTRTISSTWLNELLVGVNRSAVHYGTSADSTDWPTKLGLPNPFNATGWPTMYTCEAGGCNAFFGWDSDNVHNQNLTSETLDDNATWTRGKHTVQFGFRGRREQNNVRENQQAQGSHEWDPAYTTNWDPTAFNAATDTGSGFAELLLGLPDYLSNQYNRGYFYFRQTQLGVYVNDRIRLTPKLTLSLGLRWDYWTPYTEARHRLVVPYNPESTFEVVSTNVPVDQIPGIPPAVLTSWATTGLTWTTAKSVGYPSNLFRSVPHDFGPRVGIAYQINRNTVIRGAYGRYYVGMPLSLILQSTRNNPPLNLRFENNAFNNTNVPGGAGGCYDGVYPYISKPSPSDYLPAATVDINQPRALSPFGNAATYWDPRAWDDEHQQTWNVTLEHELPAQIGMRMSYIGTYGGNLEQQFSIDPREPVFNYVTRTGLQPPAQSNNLRAVPGWGLIGINHTGFSHDHSAQLEVRRKFANGMSFQWFYTYVRALTTTDPGGFSDGNTSVNGGGGTGRFGGSGGATVPENIELLGEPNLSYNQRLRLVYFNNTTIPPHRITFNGIYDLPFGRGKRFGNNISTPLNYVVGGWQLAAIGSWNSGLWMGVSPSLVQTGNIRIPSDKRATVTLGGTDLFRQWFAGNFNPSSVTAVSGTVAAPAVRPAGPNCSGGFVGQLAVTLGNGSCFNAPFSGFYNPDSRVNFIGPGAWNDDISIYKHFNVRERFDIRFAADFFNAFNHPNDVPPSNVSGFQNLGLQINDPARGLQPRIIQFSLRMEY
jgi:Carboxypeptidase regulatory-like domain/TonB dependent receptor